MSKTTLKSPFPKTEVDQVAPFKWPVKSIQKLGRAKSVARRDFLDVLSNRKTRRSFSAIDETDLGEFLFLANRTISRYQNEVGVDIEHRPAPSAGGLHAVQCLVHQPLDTDWGRYNPFHHQIDRLLIDSDLVNSLPKKARAFFPNASSATVIWYLADMTQLEASYFHPESLAWRDAGVLNAMHALVAAYLGYAYCPLGITGIDEAHCISGQRKFMGVGLALVGNVI
jgi:hypothetical protein